MNLSEFIFNVAKMLKVAGYQRFWKQYKSLYTGAPGWLSQLGISVRAPHQALCRQQGAAGVPYSAPPQFMFPLSE